jgi:hypothetical protein
MVDLAANREESKAGAWLFGPSWYHHGQSSPFDDENLRWTGNDAGRSKKRTAC